MKTNQIITVTICECVQVGVDRFRDKSFSRSFSVDRPVRDMLIWAHNMGIKDPTINDLEFSDYTGSSS